MDVLLITSVLTWATLAIGSVYAWGWWPTAFGVLLMAAWRCRPSGRPGTMVWAACLLMGAIAVQAVPIAVGQLEVVSPAAPRILAAFDVAFANGFFERHPLSIDPPATLRSLGFFAVCVLWTLTCLAVLRSSRAPRRLARHIGVMGTAVAIVGLANKATYNGKILWFWTPEFFAANGFGPFVNRNHFAGWMVLALTLTVGLLFTQISRSSPPASGWRERLLWLGSPGATSVLLTSAGVLAMSCALVWTMSRSGIVAGGVGLTIMLVAAIRRSRGPVQRWAVAAYLVCTILGVIGWRGTDRLIGWYGNTGTLQWRVQLWQDTLPAARDFWLTGSGLNSYGSLMMVQPRTDHSVQPREAHNDYLQLAVEGGVLVGLPALLLLAAFGRRLVLALRVPQDEGVWWIRMGAVAGICAMAVQEISEFSLQIPAVALLFCTCAAIAMHRPARPYFRHDSIGAGDLSADVGGPAHA